MTEELQKKKIVSEEEAVEFIKTLNEKLVFCS